MNAKIDYKYIAKDLISTHEVYKKLLQCAQFAECAFCGDIVRAFNKLLKIMKIGCKM